ncbi:MAG: hypothetical protein AAFN07_14525 [Pseudomonadota bacterium]
MSCVAMMTLLATASVLANEEIYGFVGSYIDLQEVDCAIKPSSDPETGETVLSICMDSIFNARYRIEQALSDELTTGAAIEFTVADHYGTPDFADYQTALLFVVKDDDAYYHLKYTWANAFPTTEGRFAECGCQHKTNDETRGCEDIVFDPAVVIDLTHASRFAIDEYETDPAFEVRGAQAVCIRGQYAETVFEIELEGRKSTADDDGQ